MYPIPEFDNARRGPGKARDESPLLAKTFRPTIPPRFSPYQSKGKKRGTEAVHGPGRRGQHQEDFERDEIAAQKINIYGCRLRVDHLDIPHK